MRATIYSTYGGNIHPDVLHYQRLVVEKFLPEDCEYEQYCPEKWTTHASALSDCVQKNPHPVTIFFDVDCIPLKPESIPALIEWVQDGALAGAVQRASHINNHEHLYVGPFCMAFLTDKYFILGEPSFYDNARGDCAEELTYCWEQFNEPVKFMWPSHVVNPLWPLRDGKMFGMGTTYNNLFYHSFVIRGDSTRQLFVDKCKEVL